MQHWCSLTLVRLMLFDILAASQPITPQRMLTAEVGPIHTGNKQQAANELCLDA